MFNDNRIPILLETIKQQASSIDNANLIIGSHTVSIGELKCRLSELREEYENYRSEANLRIKKLNILVEEKMDSQKEDIENLLIGLERTFENKINTISNGKETVTNLLRKIAELESLKDAVDHRRSSKCILEKENELNQKILNKDLLDGTDYEAKIKLQCLEWVLGKHENF